MTKKTMKYMAGLLAVVLWATPATAQQKAAEEKGAVEDARISFIQMTNLRPLGQEFDNVDYIFWSKDGSSLLVDRRYTDKRTDALEINIDTQAIKNLSANRPGGGFRFNNGAPAWNPTENGYVFVGQSESSKDFSRSIPSNGQQCNLWYYNAATNKYSALTAFQLSFTNPRGVAMPRFSPDGKKVFWCGADGGKSSLFWGQRSLFIGDFVPGAAPKIRNMKKLQPSDNNTFYESYGFTPDGTKLLFAAPFEKETPWYAADICLMNLDGSDVVNLTNTTQAWDRYPALSPKGKKIIWSSSNGFEIAYLGIGGIRWQLELKSELWIMNSNGQDKRQLTRFNRRGSEHSFLVNGRRAYVGMTAWNPDGKRIAFVVYHDKALGGNADALVSRVFVADLVESKVYNE
ncbi:MAG: PD40 domain-containing protein [Victivallales bacterium]|nr:PD40 domain-containing protein [Victivallales bacterium]MBR5078376.1 PD40 domain-containing protein [Victivallales bacterium]MBR5838144.1 PD40 domain-containing protein [Victivallales bacterium]